MPTSRTFWFLFAAFVFYVFANQTQLGWLYVIAALLCGFLPAAGLLSLSALRGIRGERLIMLSGRASLKPTPAGSIDSPRPAGEGPGVRAFHESDDITIRLRLHSVRRMPAVQVSVTETCPLAAADTPQRMLKMFIPLVPAHDTIEFDYPVTIDRRGIYTFPPVQMTTRAPFGFFRRTAALHIPTDCLIYPELRELTHLALLNRQIAAQSMFPKAGQGSEILGVRPFRPGDSPRHIHWRSVARTGKLISKEFAEETQPGLTLVLDRYCPLHPLPDIKHTPFEMAIKCAVSVAEYALRRRYALYLCAAADDMAVPSGALTLDIVLQYMARVQPQSCPALPDLLARQPMQAYVAVMMAYPDVNAVEPLIGLKYRGVNVLAVLPDPASFPIENGASMQPTAESLREAGLDVREIRFGDKWDDILSQA